MKTKKMIHRLVHPVFALAALGVLSSTACIKKSDITDAQVTSLESTDLSATSVNEALQSRLAFKVNLRTNRITLYKGGLAIDQWNIASADVSGAYHSGRAQFTPTGIYTVDDLQMCPAWYPRDPVNPNTGRVVASEAERTAVFAANPSLYGPCGARNPLGRYVLWFNGAYGLHGNAAEEILELANANERRVSGGCIRNPNEKIKSLFHTILETFDSLSGYASSVAAMESRSLNERWTITKSVNTLDMRVVVGNWSADPALQSRVANTPSQTSPSAPAQSDSSTADSAQKAAPIAPSASASAAPAAQIKVSGNKLYCTIGSVDASSGVAPVYIGLPSASARISSFYRNDWPVTVLGSVEGTDFVKVNRGFMDKKFLKGCRE
ncbi:hypothetical protein EBU99_11680 [bacterium]|nr:hypothetical protein [bacterium]